MLVPGSANPLLLRTVAAAAGGISRSLRFNSSDSGFCSRTPAGAGSLTTWTWAGWVKKCGNNTYQSLFTSSRSGFESLLLFDGERLYFYNYVSGAFAARKLVTAVFRDPSAWYHIVCTWDSTNSTAADRCRLYVNGTRIITFTTSTDPTPSEQTTLNDAYSHQIGNYVFGGSSYYFNGYLADVHFIDGQALTPSSFTEVSATTGQLIPKAYTGSYGTNGFKLNFSDNSSNTATTLGKDTSGNGNNWTPNNLSVTAGAGNDSLVDSPTNYGTDTGAGGEVRGNYCTWNPLNNGGVTLTNGNLDWQRSAGGSTAVVYSTIAVSSGKWYFETTLNGAGSGVNWEFGVARVGTSNTIRPGTTANGWGLISSSNTTLLKQNNNTTATIFTGTLANGDIIGIALDLDNGRIWFARNNTWLEGSPSAGTGASYTNLSGTVAAFAGGDGSAVNGAFNAGARPFAYPAPSGFKALCTTNLPSTTITTSGSYTGNGVADGPFVYLNGVPTAMTVNGNAVTFGTHADKLSNGFKVRTTSTTYNQNASTYNYTITTTGDPFKTARAQANP